MSVQSSEKGAGGSKDAADGDKSSPAAAAGGAAFVKVSLDGAPYLRKVDLKMYKSYQELSKALEKMFSSFTIGTYSNTSSMHEFIFLFLFSKVHQRSSKPK